MNLIKRFGNGLNETKKYTNTRWSCIPDISRVYGC